MHFTCEEIKIWVTGLLVMIWELFGNGYRWAQSGSKVTLVLGFTSLALGQDSRICRIFDLTMTSLVHFPRLSV